MPPDAAAAAQITAPAAVRIVDLDRGEGLDLARDGTPYASAMIVARNHDRPFAATTIDVSGRVRLTATELREMFPTPPAVGDDRPAAALPEVSVVVTTCAQAESVTTAVASILACDRGPLEVIVVENRPIGSNVKTRLTEEFGDTPRVRYVEEHHVGLSAARNAGLRAALGDVVTFTDDDVVVDAGWIRWIATAFATNPAAACVTGLILPSDLETRSQVLIEQFAGFGKGFERRAYSASRPTSALFPFAAGEFGSGACTALRRDIALKLRGFDVTLGAGTSARGGEDLDLFIRVLLSGHELVYEPAALIHHRHPDNDRHVRRELFSYGVGLSAMLTKQVLTGQAWAVSRRLPRATLFLADPNSRKNVRKGPEYPAAYDWIERAGMLAGPAAYLRSRNHERRLGHTVALASAEIAFEPTWVGELDVSQPLSSLRPPSPPDGHDGYARARLLVRRGAEPLGILDIALQGGSATAEAVAAKLQRQIGELPGPTAAVHARLPPISAVVCTCNRPDSLRRALASIVATEYPELEVIVVDNDPDTERTIACVEEFADPRIRRIAETQRGLSAARNRGLAAASHNIVAFTDDDVVVDRHWLSAIAAGFARDSKVACVTGLVLPAELDTVAQAYFDTKVKWPASVQSRLFDMRDNRGARLLFPYAAGELGAGANFAVRRDALATIGQFDEALGVGAPAQGGEDLDFFARVILAGWTVAYEPAAVVWHAHRRQVASLQRQMRGYGSGLGAYVFKHIVGGGAVRHVPGMLLSARGRADAPTSRGGAERQPLPQGLRTTEIVGMASGPWLYLRGRRRVRQRARRVRASPDRPDIRPAP